MTPEELGRLLSLISHEVRGPLGVMRGYMRLLDQQTDNLSESQRQAVAASLKAGERATDILNQLSTLARLHRGDAPLALARTPLEPLLRSAVHQVHMPPAPVVTVHVSDPPDVALMADGDLLRGAIAALTAAVVRAQASDNRVYLLAREEPRDREQGVIVTITAMEAISETHEDCKLDLMRGGLGLDLPIASCIIDAHRGDVHERRAQNRLTGYVLWLPTGA